MAWFKKTLGLPDAEDALAADSGAEPAVPAAEAGEEDQGELALDVYEDQDNLIIKSTIAGVKPEDLDIALSDDEITISGQRQKSGEISEENYYYQECYWGSFSRTLKLPLEVDADEAQADLKDGILIITIPKASKTKVKKVRVRGEEG